MKPLKYLGLTMFVALGMTCLPGFAQNTNPNANPNTNANAAQTNRPNANKRNLPKTASEAPLLALAGMLSLSGAVVTRKLARREA